MRSSRRCDLLTQRSEFAARFVGQHRFDGGRLVVNTADAMIAAAVAGVGITRILSFQVANTVRTGDLVLVLREFQSPAVPVSLVHAGQGLVPLKLRAFLDFAAPRLQARLS